MIDKLIGSGFAPEMVVVLISTLPVAELRGALPVAINLFHLPWYQAFYLAVIGNLLPVPVLLLLFESLIKVMRQTETGDRLVNWLFKRTRQRMGVIRKYERIGLMLFVAIPVPATGAWTGCVAASLGGLKFKDAFLSITCGVIISGAIVTSLCLLGWVGAVIAGLGLVSLAIVPFWKA